MARTFFCVAMALLLGGISARAQSGNYTEQFRVSPPAPTAPNPFSRPAANSSQQPFGKPVPQRFNASPIPGSVRTPVIFVRNRVIALPGHPGHQAAPAAIAVPSLLYPISKVCTIDPYAYHLSGTRPAPNGFDRLASPSSYFGLEASTDPGGKARIRTSTVMFKSDPADAELYIDGKHVGETPFSVPLASGLHSISIEQRGYHDWRQTLTVSAGGRIIIDATLREN